MHQSFVTPSQHTHTHTENSGDNGFSSITALGPAERQSPAPYNNKFNGIYMQNIISPAAGELERPMPHTLAPLSSPIPVGVCVGEGVVSGYK